MSSKSPAILIISNLNIVKIKKIKKTKLTRRMIEPDEPFSKYSQSYNGNLPLSISRFPVWF